MPPKITAKAPNISTVQVDNKEWVKVSEEQMNTLKLGDSLEASKGAEKPLEIKKAAPYRSGFGQPLSEYDLELQRTIGVATMMHAVLQSDIMNMIPDGLTITQFVEQETIKLMAIVKKLSGTK